MEDSEHLLDDDDKECECLLKDENGAFMQQSKRNCFANATAAKNEKVVSSVGRVSLHSRRSRKVRILTV
jgi:hypothetical protein